MGALLTINLMQSTLASDNKYIGGILLSPALSMKNKLFNLVKLLKYVKKYQYKGIQSEKFFQQNNLFSYTFRSLKASDELRKLVNLTKSQIKNVHKPMLALLAENDELVDIRQVNFLLEENPKFEIQKIPKMGHIFTVFPQSEYIFDNILQWIKKIL